VKIKIVVSVTSHMDLAIQFPVNAFVLLDGSVLTATSETKIVLQFVLLMVLAQLLLVCVFVPQDGKGLIVIPCFALLVTLEEVYVMLVFVTVLLFGQDSSVTFQLDHVLETVYVEVI